MKQNVSNQLNMPAKIGQMGRVMPLGLILFLTLLSIVMNGLSSHAASARTPQAAQYFMMIQDLPLMPGLVELADQALVFDKPEGRILESAALSQGPSMDEVQEFYRASLPALGWRVSSHADLGLVYIRDHELLQIRFDRRETSLFVRFMISPVPPP